MKRYAVGLIIVILGFALLISPSISDARGGHWGGGGHHSGFHGRFFFGFGAGFWPGYYAGYSPFYWGAPIVGWPYYPPVVTEGPPAYSEPEQQQPFYWYYCQNPQGYYPYVKSCPGGWMTVVPNVNPPNQ
jgi:hypothetical protein